MDLDEAAEFYTAFLDALYQYELAVRTEPDDVVAERRARVESFLDPRRGTWVGTWSTRSPGLTPEQISERAAKLAPVQRPSLFLVAEFTVADWGSVFAGYAGDSGKRTYHTYMFRYLAAEVDGKPAIISQYSIEPSYGPPGEVTWDFTQGVEIADLGRAIAARGLQEPVLDDQIEDYQRILREAGAA